VDGRKKMKIIRHVKNVVTKNMNKLINKLKGTMNRTETENGAQTLTHSGKSIVDFFALAGATRDNPEIGIELFSKALIENPEKAIKILFYLRDIRGGQGERTLFRNCISYLRENKPEIANTIAKYTPEYGRYDDLLSFEIDTIAPIIKEQLIQDFKSETPSLLAKWLPSENASSKETKAKAREIMKALGASPREYRKTLSQLRKKIKLVEQKMSRKEFNEIEYSKVPSQASLKYKKAFFRNDENRYTTYLESVNKGEEKINTRTLFPHQIYERASETGSDELWKNLPDYTRGKNGIVVADVSGSMQGRPMSVSVSLALYFAERNQGAFHNHFITFSETPEIQEIKGETLEEKIKMIEKTEWGYNTDLNKIFTVLLNTAVQNKVSEKDMPETIYIISDMQFDQASPTRTSYELIQDQYKEAGYKIPNVVFWNVDARNTNIPTTATEKGVTLVSGFSPSTFKIAVENKTPEEVVEDVINSERYKDIKIA